MKVSVFCTLICALSCTITTKERIASADKEFSIENQLDVVDQKLESSADDVELHQLKLALCQYVGWPKDCITSLEFLRRTQGINSFLLEDYLDYYDIHENAALLYSLMDRVPFKTLDPRAKKQYIGQLVSVKRWVEAKEYLGDYIKDIESVDQHVFVFDAYLNLHDTVKAISYAGKLYDYQGFHPSLSRPIEFFLEAGYQEKAMKLLNNAVSDQNLAKKDSITIGSIALTYKLRDLVEDFLRPFATVDTVAVALADFYEANQRWRESQQLLESALDANPASTLLLLRLSDHFEAKGWYNNALSYLKELERFIPGDTLLLKRMNAIKGKQAYLQRKNERENPEAQGYSSRL
ncbi:MAG: hypothetical protein AAF789_09580 [Bacteroidota bacterium]